MARFRQSKSTYNSKPPALKFKTVKESKGKSSISDQYIDESWKNDARRAYDHIPEVAVSVDLTAKMVAECTLSIGIEGSDGAVTPVGETEYPEAKRLLRSLRSPLGAQKEILSSMAQNMQITGDGYLVGTPKNYVNNSPFDYEWEFLSTSEIVVKNGPSDNSKVSRQFFRVKNGDIREKCLSNSTVNGKSIGEQLSDDIVIARMWRPSPHYAHLSDCSLKKNLVICKEILKLTDVINAVNNSRLSAGMMIFPEELSFGSPDEGYDSAASEEGARDEFVDELITALSAPIQDRSSAHSLVPLLLQAKSDLIEKIKLFKFAQDFNPEYRAVREELIKRLVIGLDIPVEIVQGKSSVNHWTGHAIEAEFVSKHVIPLGNLIATRMTVGFLRPLLYELNYSPEDIEKLHIIFDPSNIVTRADKETIARRLYEVNAISKETLVKASGFSKDDMQSEEEAKQNMLFELIKTSPVTLAPVLLPYLTGFAHFKDEMNEIASVIIGSKDPNAYVDSIDRESRDTKKKLNEDDPREKDGNQTPNPDNQNKERNIGQKDADTRAPNATLDNLNEVLSSWFYDTVEYSTSQIKKSIKDYNSLTSTTQLLDAEQFSSLELLASFDKVASTLSLTNNDIFREPMAKLGLTLDSFFKDNRLVHDDYVKDVILMLQGDMTLLLDLMTQMPVDVSSAVISKSLDIISEKYGLE